MAELKTLDSNEQLDEVWETSKEHPVFLFKHSTTCPISAQAFAQYQTFLKKAEDNIDFYLVKVREQRPISNQIAEMTGVKHESPQIFLIKNKKVLWNTSHTKITAESMEEAIKNN